MMKRNSIFAAAVCCALACHAQQIEFHSENAFSFPVENKSHPDPDSFSFKYSTGAKLTARNVSAVYFTGIGATDFPALAAAIPHGIDSMQRKRYGAKWSAQTRIVHADILAGTLLYSQGISRLKTPYITVPSALRKPSLLTPGISPELPSCSSSEKPLSLALSVSPGTQLPFLPTVQIAALETAEVYAGIFKRFSLPFAPSGSLSFSGGLFKFGRENTSSWFQKQQYFQEKKRLALEAELNLSYPGLRIASAAGIHESPFGGGYGWARIQDFILLGDFTLHSFYYIADASLITASKSEPGIRSQLCINPQYIFWLGKTSLNMGILLYTAERRTRERICESFSEKKAKAALTVQSGKHTVSTSGTVSRSEEDGFSEYSLQLKLSGKYRPLSFTSQVSFKNEDRDKNTVSFTQYVYPKKAAAASLSAGISVSEKDGDISAVPSASASFKGGGKKVRWNVKASFSVSF